MSCSAMMMRSAITPATSIGPKARRSGNSRLPIRWVGIVSSSRLSMKYDAKKIDEQQLGDLDRLELDRGEVHPQARAVDLLADPGQQRRDEEQKGADGEQVAVALEVAAAPHDEEHGRVEHEPDHRPGELLARPRRVAPLDHHVAQAVQEERHRHDDRVGVRREPSG